MRTSLALFGLGFVVARFVMSAGESASGISSGRHVAEMTAAVLGIVFVFVGAVAAAAAAMRYRGYLIDAAPEGHLLQGATASFVTTVLVAVLGTLLGLALIAAGA